METIVTTPRKRLEEHGSRDADECIVLSKDEIQYQMVASSSTSESKESHGEELHPPTREWDEGEEGIDHISGLPNGVLGTNISFLPTKDGARTQILASQWRSIWAQAPLNLDHNSLPINKEVQAELISHILDNHRGPIRCLSLSVVHLHHHRATLNTWLQSPTLKNLRDLEFEATGLVHIPRLRRLLSEYVFKFSHTLCSTTISECQVRDTIEMHHFPNLKQLGLERS
jgi:hypothetical protein